MLVIYLPFFHVSFLYIKRKNILFKALIYAEKYLNISAPLQNYE